MLLRDRSPFKNSNPVPLFHGYGLRRLEELGLVMHKKIRVKHHKLKFLFPLCLDNNQFGTCIHLTEKKNKWKDNIRQKR